MRTLTSLALLAALTTAAHADRKPAPLARFSAKLHGAVTKPGENLVYSPSSIGIALAMTREGATRETAAEMDRVLGATAGPEARALLASLALATGKPGAPELAIANRLFGDEALKIEKPFLAMTRDGYGAPLEQVTFRAKPEQARAGINAWVDTQTRGKIKDLLGPGVITTLTRLVLVNAIYLKARWKSPFEKRDTVAAKFEVAGAGAKQVPTMHGAVGASWGSYAGARLLDLPYRSGGDGPQLSMLLVVPQRGKLEAIEATYVKEGLAGFLAAASTRGEVSVALPTFRIASGLSLGNTLAALGMPRAFDADLAQLDGIAKGARLHISQVIHRAVIEVDEHGTEAAAATAVVITTDAPSRPKHTFAADRSFAYFIHDEQGVVLFAGRVVDPSRR
ncbi:MAG: serpin family protein [Deltaproteobacteria bacterium]|nr:serpin family protein [Deltaproteobacteria bacterium]MDQ3299030.1 serpin family protein [Myxococcota bacterium]